MRIGSNLSMMVLLNECLRFADWWHPWKQYQLHMPLFFVMQRLDIMNDVPNSGVIFNVEVRMLVVGYTSNSLLLCA